MKPEGAITDIMICGGGLAAWMTACALRAALPPAVKLTVLDIAGSDKHDIFYGTVTSPTAYNFNLASGVTEPDLLLMTATSFSYGTSYENWSAAKLSWIQCHHLPFPVYDGVPFAQIVSAQGDLDLEPYLASAQAARNGRFIHPPKDPANPMSRAEYGYQFNPVEWADIFKKIVLDKGIEHVKTPSITVNRAGSIIKDIELPDGRRLSADFYIDCGGPRSDLSDADDAQKDGLQLAVSMSETPASNLGPPFRRIKATSTGWTSETYLKNSVLRLSLGHEDGLANVYGAAIITAGKKPSAWTGNCVSLGHAASVIEPLTPAPMMLLQRDIKRLLTLIPLSSDMSVEAGAYNQAFNDDYQHCLIFNQAFFAGLKFPETPYWTQLQSVGMDKKLTRKLAQFESRSLHVTYDLEPFTEQDWAILHFGMKRRPARLDVFAELQDQQQTKQRLSNITQNLQNMTEKMPPHHIYMEKLVSYLKRKQGSHV